MRKQFKNPGKKIWAIGRVYSTRNTLKPESYLSLKAVLFPEEAKVNLGNAGQSRRVAIWLQWGVLEWWGREEEHRADIQECKAKELTTYTLCLLEMAPFFGA